MWAIVFDEIKTSVMLISEAYFAFPNNLEAFRSLEKVPSERDVLIL